eukprot:Skav213368  [mRNA]  locus=scaffold317:496013:499707:+ [translate_table: standard]
MVSPIGVRGRGASAVAVECSGELELEGILVGKFYKVPSQREAPAPVLHEFEMLKAAQECPYVVKAVGVFHMPLTFPLAEIVGLGGTLPPTGLTIPGAFETPKICALFMEKCDHSLQDLVGPGLDGLDWEGDFGLATILETDTDTVPDSRCGTHGFLAPECLEEKVFCKESDLFAVGAMLYQLLFRTYAFIRESQIETIIATRIGQLPLIPCGSAVGKSDEACELIRRLLNRCPSARPSAEGALKHAWFRDVDGDVTLRSFIVEQNLRQQDGDCASLVGRRNAMLPEEAKARG